MYHFHTKIIGRSQGRRVCAKAAYNAGTRVKDHQLGEVFDYSRKRGVDDGGIVLPKGVAWARERENLWNIAEQAEVRRNSRTAREIEVALPRELPRKRNLILIRDFVVKELVERHGVACQVDFHGLSTSNPHCHILMTTRRVEPEGIGEKVRELDRVEELERLREQWAVLQNAALAKAGVDKRVDHRSLSAQGLSRIPQIHLGPVIKMELRGVETVRGAMARSIEFRNRFECVESAHLDSSNGDSLCGPGLGL